MRDTASVASASEAVSPGDSMPKRFSTPRTPCVRRIVDAEIRGRLAGPGDLRANSGVRRLQRPIRKARPVAADRGVKALTALRIHTVLAPLDPLHVRPEARAPGQIEREVNAEPALLGQRVDETLERSPAAEREVVALGEVRRRDMAGRKALHDPRHGGRLYAGAVDQQLRTQRRLRPVHPDQHARLLEHQSRDFAAAGERGAAALCIREQRQHVGLRIDDAGERGVQCRNARKLWLQRLRRRALQRAELDAVGERCGGDGGEPRELRGIGRYDELAAATVRDAALAAEGV